MDADHKVSGWRRATGLVLAVPIIYVGSALVIGALLMFGILDEEFTETWIAPIYTPLEWLAEEYPALDAMFMRYGEWLESLR